jgi:hypothetical protein
MAPASYHASLGTSGTASPYAGYSRRHSNEMARKRSPRAHTNLPVPDDGPQNANLRDGGIDIKRLQ